MSEEPDNLVVAYLREIRARLDSMEARMTSLEAKVDEGFDDQTQRGNGIALILTMLAGNVHAVEERVEALEKVRQ